MKSCRVGVVAAVAFSLPMAAWSQEADDANASSAPLAEAPRVDAVDEAGVAEVILNEINTDAYPEVRLFVTVLRDGEPVDGLVASDFRVREDEVDQTPLTVEAQLPPLSVVLAIDTSGSMAPAIADAKAAARDFLNTLTPQDNAQLLGFAREITEYTGMSTDRAALSTSIDALSARGDTALYDALARSVELVDEEQGRKAIVLLSDGVDDDGAGSPLSEATADSVLSDAAAVNVPIFVVGLGDELDVEGLTRIASASGGRFLTAADASELGEVYAIIGSQLSGQYAVTYTSSLPADGTLRRIDLEAAGQQTSKSYTPDADAATAAAAAAPSTGCAVADLFTSYLPDYAELTALEAEGLLTSSVVYGQTEAIKDELLAAVEAAPVSLDCTTRIYEVVTQAREAETAESTATDQILRAVIAKANAECVQNGADPDGFRACFMSTLPLEDFYRTLAQKDLVEPFAVAIGQSMDRREALTYLRDAIASGLPITSQTQNQILEVLMQE
ncbi:VWA domain-containing protein [Rubellimicrobium rubrum]|uniref:VWA domain-containing protein n=1 Tax=Rubellimicrobium rubrum TaxID=2585369 RepID=A0A5C4MSX6_9RHOB|nr:VWA domain-containing protein [Rubellimicrobium rubrum]TNC47727.1 VWA domain-containing protein [Rubellimicrobium rubrum]